MSPQMSKSELISRIQRSYDDLEFYLRTLSDSQLTGPESPEGWTAKDHLVHLTKWEAGLVALLHRQPRFAAMGLDDAFVAQHDEDEINQRIYLDNRAHTLPDVLAAFRETHRQMVAVLTALSEQELYAPYAHFVPGEPPGDDRRPVIGWVQGNTYDHYESHLGWMRELLKS